MKDNYLICLTIGPMYAQAFVHLLPLLKSSMPNAVVCQSIYKATTDYNLWTKTRAQSKQFSCKGRGGSQLVIVLCLLLRPYEFESH